MNYNDPALVDALAREYALGTLRGPARRRLARIAGENLIVRRAINQWQDRLAGLANELSPVVPPESVWLNVERALGHAGNTDAVTRRTGGFSGALAAVFAALAVTFGALYFTQQAEVMTPDYIALLNDGEQQPAWSVQAFSADAGLRIRALASIAPPAGRVFELWMLPEDGSNPVSLGLIGDGVTTLALNPLQLTTLANSSALAISEEPPGGSPTGVPTGDVLFVGALADG